MHTHKSAQTMSNSQKEATITLAGGRIRCRRCQAKSKRSGLQCKKPALKTSKTQKCSFHGGRSTGPKTPEGRQRIADAKAIHGNDSRATRKEQSEGYARMRNYENIMHILGMTTAPKWRGRKPVGYVPVRTFDEALAWIAEDAVKRHHKVKF